VTLTFTDPDAWHGSAYDLFIHFGALSDVRLVEIIARLWEHPLLDGPFLDKTREPAEQAVADHASLSNEPGKSYGTMELPEGLVVAGTFASRDLAAEPGSGSGDAWLTFWVPLGSLLRVWPEVAPYPFLDSEDDAKRHVDWQQRLEELLAGIARHIFDSAPFRYAIIGHELEVTDEDLERWSTWREEMPDERWDGALVPAGERLEWHPPTRRGGWTLSQSPGNPSSWREVFGSD